MFRIIQGIVVSVALCAPVLAQYTTDWRPIDKEKQVIYGEEGSFKMFVYVVDDVTLLGIASTEPHDKTPPFRTPVHTDVLKLVHGTDSLAFYRLTAPTTDALLTSKQFTLTIKERDVEVITGDLKDVYQLVTNNFDKSDLDSPMDKALCMLSKAYRRHAIVNRQAGLSEQESLEAITQSSVDYKDKASSTEADAVKKALIFIANNEIYKVGDALFNNATALSNLQSLIHQQCLKSEPKALTQTQVNSRDRAERVLSDALKLLFKGQGIPAEDLNKITSQLPSCMLDKIGNQSTRVQAFYIQELNKTGSLIEARDNSSMRIKEEGLMFDSDVISQGLQACVAGISDKQY
jgi:hypothetical protein